MSMRRGWLTRAVARLQVKVIRKCFPGGTSYTTIKVDWSPNTKQNRIAVWLGNNLRRSGRCRQGIHRRLEAPRRFLMRPVMNPRPESSRTAVAGSGIASAPEDCAWTEMDIVC